MDELEVLESIYLDDLKVEKAESGYPISVQLRLHPATGDELDKRYVCMTLTLKITEKYPDEVPEIVITNPRGIAEEEVQSLLQELEMFAEEKVGSEMLYEMIELAKESLTEGNVPYCPCTICCEHFSEDDLFTKTDCYHYFHNHCLRRYIEHQQEVLEELKAGRVQHAETKDDDEKMRCPVCREEINYDLEYLQKEVYDVDKEQITYHPSEDVRVWQNSMAELYRKQKEKGGIIDVEAEKNRYLLTESDTDVPVMIDNMGTDSIKDKEEPHENNEKENSTNLASGHIKFHHQRGQSRGQGSIDTHHHGQGRGQGSIDTHPRGQGRGQGSNDTHHHGQGRGQGSTDTHQNHRYSNNYRPMSSSGQRRGYVRSEHSGSARYGRGFQRGNNFRSYRATESVKPEIKEKQDVNDKVGKETEMSLKCNDIVKESVSEKPESNVPTKESIPNRDKGLNYHRSDRYSKNKSNQGRSDFSTGNNSRPVRQDNNRRGYSKGDYSSKASDYKDVDNSKNGNSDSKIDADFKLATTDEDTTFIKNKKNGTQSHSDESESHIDREELSEKLCVLDIKDSEKDSIQKRNSEKEYVKTSNKNGFDRSQSNFDKKYRGRGQRPHSGHEEKSKGQHFEEEGQHVSHRSKAQDYYERKGTHHDNFYSDDYYYDRGPHRRRGHGHHSLRGSQGYHKENRGQGHSRNQEKLPSGKKEFVIVEKPKEDSKTSVIGQKEDIVHKNETTDGKKSDSIQNDNESKQNNDKKFSFKNTSDIPDSKHSYRDSDVDNTKNNNSHKENIGEGLKPCLHLMETKSKNKPPGFLIKHPPHGFSEKAVKPPPGF